MIDFLSDWPALGAAGEQAWQVLRQHTEWTEGFWLAWLFTGYPPMAHELETRMEGFLNECGQRQVVLRPGTPEEVRNLLEVILAEETRAAHCVWIEIIHSDGLGIGNEPMPGPWTEAWDWLMMRANERRTALAKHLPGGLVFVGPAVFKDRARRAAPDLWSIRALVLEPAPPALQPLPGMFDSLPALSLPKYSGGAPDVELALEQAARVRAQGHRADESKALMRAADGLMARGETAEALRRASEAVDAAGDEVELKAHALALLGQVESKHGDRIAAERHLSAALALIQERDDLTGITWMGALATLLLQRGAWVEAEQAYLALTARAQAHLQREPGSVLAKVAQVVGLNGMGMARVMLLRLDEAAEAFTSAKETIQPLLTVRSFDVVALTLSAAMSALGLGRIHLTRGDLERAEQLYRTAFAFLTQWSAIGSSTEGDDRQTAQALHYEVLATLAWILLARGNFEESERTLLELQQLAQDIEVRSLWRPPLQLFVMHHGLALMFAGHHDDQASMLEHMEQILTLSRLHYQAGNLDVNQLAGFRDGLEVVARLRRAAGDEAGARAAEDELAALPQAGSDS